MSQVVLLDSGIIGLITAPRGTPVSLACSEWIQSLTDVGDLVFVPEICDYEVRRELLRADKRDGLSRLDRLGVELGYLALTTECMRIAATLWADARRQGQPTAADAALDGDVILAAQARDIAADFGWPTVVATDNVVHLSRYVDARRWEKIQPSQPPV